MKNRHAILMTGATGFLGSNLLKRLHKDYNVVLLVRKTSDLSRLKNVLKVNSLVYCEEKNIKDIFSSKRIDCVLHCATNYGRKGQSPLAILESNLVLPLKLLQYGSERGLKCFINTDTVLGMNISHYALSKAHFKEWLKVYSNRMSCVNVALEHFYGPGDDETKFVAWVLNSLLTGKCQLDLTAGDQKRELIYIDDVVEAFTSVVKASLNGKSGFTSYEIGTGKPVKIKDFVLLAKQLTGNTKTHLNFGVLPYRDNEVMSYKTDLTEIRKIGWEPRFSLKKGILRTISLNNAHKILPSE